MEAAQRFVIKNPVLTIAFFCALLTCFLVPPDAAYTGYLDFKTLTCLFCVLAVVGALKDLHFFTLLAEKIVHAFHNARSCIIALVYITFIGSMLIANDMALLTFLPLGYLVLKSTKNEKHMAFTFIMQNIAANLGGMLTPFGNPQNLFLYTKFSIPNVDFIHIMLPPFLAAIGLITVCCLFVKPEALYIEDREIKLPPLRTGIALLLFALSILIVFRSIPFWIGLCVIPPVLWVMDREALKKVDYPLLLTFVCFFIFAGNMGRISLIQQIFSGLMNKNALLVSVLSCQFISNVPSAILLSQFTQNYSDLLVGVNIGGVGTLISSLASLITFREYTKHYPQKTGRYVLLFSVFNFGFLFLLTGFMLVKLQLQ